MKYSDIWQYLVCAEYGYLAPYDAQGLANYIIKAEAGKVRADKVDACKAALRKQGYDLVSGKAVMA